MTDFFQAYFTMAFEACIVILIVLCVRPLFRRYSNRMVCFLWLAVLFRLLSPYTVEGPIPAFWQEWGRSSEQTELRDKEAYDIYHEAKRDTIVGEDQGLFQDTWMKKTEETRESVEPWQGGEEETRSVQQGDQEKAQARQHTGQAETGQGNQETVQFAPKKAGTDIRQTQQESQNDIWPLRQGAQAEMREVHTEGEKLGDGPETSRKTLTNILGVIWLFGAVLLTLLGVWKYWRLAAKLREAIPHGEWEGIPMKVSDARGVPMSFGILQAGIYLPDWVTACDDPAKEAIETDGTGTEERNNKTKITREQMELILRHEAMHVRRHDPLWKLLALLALGIHWWNPLVWLACFLLAEDIEMACDEGVLDAIGETGRAQYAETLLQFATYQSGIFVPVSFGQSHTEGRIKNILCYRKPSMILSIALFVGALTLGGCLVTKPEKTREQNNGTESTPSQESGWSGTQGGNAAAFSKEIYGAKRKGDAGDYLYESSGDLRRAWNDLWSKEFLIEIGILNPSDAFWNHGSTEWMEDRDSEKYILTYDGVLLNEAKEVMHLHLILRYFKGEDLYYHLSEPEFYRNDRIESREQAMCFSPCFWGVVQRSPAEGREQAGQQAGQETEGRLKISLSTGSYGEQTDVLLIDELAAHYKEHAPECYQALLDPVSALEELMHLQGGSGEGCYENAQRCLVCYTFADGSRAHYDMTLRDGVWYPSSMEELEEFRINVLHDFIGEYSNLPSYGAERMAELKARNNAMETVTASVLQNGTARLEDDAIVSALPESLWKGKWKGGQAGEFILLAEIPQEDAGLYGLYGGETLVLRVKDKVYPFLFNWTYLPNALEFHSGDFDGDGETEYAFLTHVEWGTMNVEEYYRKDELYILEIRGDEILIHSFDEAKRGKQLRETLSCHYAEGAGEGRIVRGLTVRAVEGAEETWCYLSLDKMDKLLEEHSFQNITFGDVEEIRLLDDQWYYIDLGGIRCAGIYPLHYECSVQLSSLVEYRDDGTFTLKNMELESQYPDIEGADLPGAEAFGGYGQEAKWEEVISVLRADITHDGRDDVIVTSVTYPGNGQALDWKERVNQGANCFIRVYRGSDIPAKASDGKGALNVFSGAAFYDNEKYQSTGGFNPNQAIYVENLAASGFGGNNPIYIAKRDGREYLLTEYHRMYHTEMDSAYQVFALDENGNRLMVEKCEGPFFRIDETATDGWSALPVDDMVTYSKKLDEWIGDGTMILMMYHMQSASGGMQVLRTQGETFAAWEVWQETDETVEYLITQFLRNGSQSITYQGPAKKKLRDMEHLRESLENLNLRWQALHAAEEAYTEAHRVDHEEQEGKQITHSDLTGDLLREMITVEYAAFQADNQQPVVISVQNGEGRLIWSDQIWGPHMGWGMYYHVIHGEDDRHYLLHLLPIEYSQGTYYGEFQIFSFDEGGKKVILDERHVSSDEEKSNYAKAKTEYLEALNAYLERSFLLAGIWDFELSLYDSRNPGRTVWK